MTPSIRNVDSTGPRSMLISEFLVPERILVDTDGGFVRNKGDALRLLSSLLGGSADMDQGIIEQKLIERERLVSTGIGDGVAIPHTSLEEVETQLAALLLCPEGIDFEAVDNAPVRIIFGVVGPKRATGEHLRVLARISRLLRDVATRDELVASPDPATAYRLLEAHDRKLR